MLIFEIDKGLVLMLIGAAMMIIGLWMLGDEDE